MRHAHRWLVLVAVYVVAQASAARPPAADGPVLGARHAPATVQIKIFNPAGSVALLGWDRDSVVVRGRVGKSESFYFYGRGEAMKIGIEDRIRGTPARSDLEIWLPKRSQVSLKTVDGDITTRDASGWFYTVAGDVRMSGAASSLDVQSMSGSIDLDVTTPWLRARCGDGNLLVRGHPQDVDASTITGTLSVASATILRAQLASVSGDIHYAGSPAPGGIFDFSDHSGAVELLLPHDVSGSFALSSIVGPIENGLPGVRPAATTPRSVRFTLGRGGASITVRTFKGAIRLRAE